MTELSYPSKLIVNLCRFLPQAYFNALGSGFCAAFASMFGKLMVNPLAEEFLLADTILSLCQVRVREVSFKITAASTIR